jgi:hypothetical protein
LANMVLGRKVLILQQELLIYQSGNVGQEPRPRSFFLSSILILENRVPSAHPSILTIRGRFHEGASLARGAWRASYRRPAHCATCTRRSQMSLSAARRLGRDCC